MARADLERRGAACRSADHLERDGKLALEDAYRGRRLGVSGCLGRPDFSADRDPPRQEDAHSGCHSRRDRENETASRRDRFVESAEVRDRVPQPNYRQAALEQDHSRGHAAPGASSQGWICIGITGDGRPAHLRLFRFLRALLLRLRGPVGLETRPGVPGDGGFIGRRQFARAFRERTRDCRRSGTAVVRGGDRQKDR